MKAHTLKSYLRAGRTRPKNTRLLPTQSRTKVGRRTSGADCSARTSGVEGDVAVDGVAGGRWPNVAFDRASVGDCLRVGGGTHCAAGRALVSEGEETTFIPRRASPVLRPESGDARRPRLKPARLVLARTERENLEIRAKQAPIHSGLSDLSATESGKAERRPLRALR